jgi:hypothetical protein
MITSMRPVMSRLAKSIAAVFFSADLAHRGAYERHAAAFCDHARHFVGAPAFERGNSQTVERRFVKSSRHFSGNAPSIVVMHISHAARRRMSAHNSCYVEFLLRDSGLRRALSAFSTCEARRKNSRDAQRWQTFATCMTTKYGDEDFFLTDGVNRAQWRAVDTRFADQLLWCL